MSSGKLSNPKELIFTEKDHTYKVDNMKLTSVTTLLKDYFSPFDAKKIAKKLAMMQKGRNGKKYKLGEEITDEDKKKATQKYWKAEWKEASNHGTRIHKGLENAVRSPKDSMQAIWDNSIEERDTKKMTQGWTFLSLHSDKDTELIPELQLYDLELGLAGTIDLVITKDKKTSLADWKTNKRIDRKGYQGAMALPPISELPDCNYSKYALQLGVYAFMLERKGYLIDKLYLVHLKEDSFTPYEIDYQEVKPFVEAILNEKENSRGTDARAKSSAKNKSRSIIKTDT